MVVFVHGQKKVSATDSYFLIDSSAGRVWVPTKTQNLEKFISPTPSEEPAQYTFNPGLREVYLTKEGKQPMPIDDIKALKDNPNEQIGVVEIVLDRAASNDPKSAKSVRFFYPNYGEKQLNSYQLLQMEAQVQPSKDPLTIKLPVFRKASSRYLVQVPSNWSDAFYEKDRYRHRAALASSVSPFVELELYAWVVAE